MTGQPVRPLRGYHLHLDGRGIRRRKGDIALFLAQAIEATDLTPISDPVVMADVGFVVIAESHVAAHIKGDAAFLDVFSCRPFRWARIKACARTIFGGEWEHLYRMRPERGKG